MRSILCVLLGGLVLTIGGASQAEEPKDLVDTAVAAGNFKTLAAALKAADLVDALKGKGPFTVFAPTDEAFAKLPKETLESLLKPENKDKLVAILKYHVVSGKVSSEHLMKANDPAIEQYQLWIFDKNQDEMTPIDGGVFDIGTEEESVVPIRAALTVRQPYLFAVTIEKPGGVVVSDRKRLPLLASLQR